ncbi:glycosyltransferase family 2 protein [Listeria booriae]|uniref:Glycosyltransferase n=1 Tax=Listeria booriae TaxID=1552123 RepID=A0A7X0ZSV8_9LIST|nr:glycosyltransferase [Listeria booriae]MBC1335601.1 glycosyltransferase [Listeria booriae]MBC1649507.1 glycosyltransferase [Listeria booriae]MBC2259456.1 glycosyltransferase [Listeria booriae]MBC2305797.1 glycosyltransferase [Listeria booriae]MBC2309380.1 glycosyltransferase [Listeria booriae]
MTGLIHLFTIISVVLVCIYFGYTTFILLLPPFKKQDDAEITKTDTDFYYLFLVPCLNEEKVITKTVQSILDLPHKHKMVIVVDDDSDDETVARVRAMRLHNAKVIERKLPNAQLGKGESLNYSFQKIKRAVTKLGADPSKIILTVIDGDGRPSQNLLLEADKMFADPAVGAAQTRIRITNRHKLMPMMQDIEFFSTVSSIQNSREYTDSVGLGGNGQFTRLSALYELGETPWSKCLLEDFDLGLSILLKGWKNKYISEAVVYQQGLTSIKRFVKQRARWVQGNIQSMNRLKEINHSKLSNISKMDLYYFLAQPWINLLGSLIMVFSWVFMALFFHQIQISSAISNTWENWSAIAFLLLLIFSPGLTWCMYHYSVSKNDIDSTSFWRCIVAGLVMPLYNLLTIPSIWIAFWRQLFKKEGWTKTERLDDDMVQQ